jgi:hypothetical protein
MAGNAQKTFYGREQHRFVRGKIKVAQWLLGKRLPASVVAVGPSGATVTIKFECNPGVFTLPQVTVPVHQFEYIRYPIQPGCLGYTQAADTLIGNVSGLGSAAPPALVQPSNLSGLAFVPLGNVNWTAPDDTQAVVIYGPNGVIARTTDGQNKLTINASGIMLADVTGNLIELQSDGVTVETLQMTIDGDLTVTGSLSANPDATGTFTSQDGKTITVAKGIITSIV